MNKPLGRSIALILGATAIFLARESKGLLLGKPASPEVQKKVLAVVQQDPAVQRANGIPSVHIGPRENVAGLSIEFEDHLRAPEIEACVDRLEARLKEEMPQVTRLFVKPQMTAPGNSGARLLKLRQETSRTEPVKMLVKQEEQG